MYPVHCAGCLRPALASLSPGLRQLAAYSCGQHQGWCCQPAQPELTAGSSPVTTRELTRDLAGWSLPPVAPAGAGRLASQWRW